MGLRRKKQGAEESKRILELLEELNSLHRKVGAQKVSDRHPNISIKNILHHIGICNQELNEGLKVKPAFTGRDKIILHFNRVLPHEVKEKTDEILKRKYVYHIATHKFGATYAAKCFIDTVRELSEFKVLEPTEKWVGPNRLYINNWILISSDPDSEVDLEDIIEYEYTKEEKKWRLPVPYPEYAETIARHGQGTHPQLNTRTRESQGKPPLTDAEKKKVGLRVPSEPTREKAARKEKPERKKKERPAGIISLADICKKLKCDPREARQALRKSKAKKPDIGWAWPQKEEAQVTKDLEKALKKLRSK